MQRFRVDLKTFWAWLCLTNAAVLSESKYLADFLVGFLDKKPQTLSIPIYRLCYMILNAHMHIPALSELR